MNAVRGMDGAGAGFYTAAGMARSKFGKWASVALVAAVGAGVYQYSAGSDTAEEGLKLLANQVWLERLPADDRDQIHHVVFIDNRRDRFGAFGRSSTWRHAIEVFRWNREEGRLTLLLPQDRVRLDLGVRVWNCEGEAPEPFELCLELKTAKGRTGHYYSRHDWKIDAETGAVPTIAGAPAFELPAAPPLPADLVLAAAEDAELLAD